MRYLVVFSTLYRNHQEAPLQIIFGLTRVEAALSQRSVTLCATLIWDPKLAESHT